MNENEENVYSSMGLDPILLLDEVPASENYIVQIIRPGEEKDNNKDKILCKNKNAIELDSTNPKEIISSKVEDNNLDLDLEKNDSISDDNISINEKNELNSTESKEVDEDPRRKRRRSSAS